MRFISTSIIILILFFSFLVGIGMTGNTNTSKTWYEAATVDTLPTGLGHATVPLNIYKQSKKLSELTLTVEGTGVGEVTLQFKGPLASAYTDYGTETYPVGTAVTVHDLSAGGLWQAIMKPGDYTSGTIYFGLYWH